MKLSIIMPVYQDLVAAHMCLNSLQMFDSTNDNQYIIQDDTSPNFHGMAVFSQLICEPQRNETNLGFAGNCNAGAARATGDVLFFVNQDVYAVPHWAYGWDYQLLRVFNEQPDVQIVGLRLLFPDGRIQSAGGWYDGKGQPYHRCLGYSNPHAPEVSTPREMSWVTGAALAIRRSTFEKVGGFDTAYERGYFEDVDLCEKVKTLGGKVWYEPRATLIHRVGTTGGNPNFLKNARLFHSRWVANHRVKPDTSAVMENFW